MNPPEIQLVSEAILTVVFCLGMLVGGVISVITQAVKEKRAYENSRAD